MDAAPTTFTITNGSLFYECNNTGAPVSLDVKQAGSLLIATPETVTLLRIFNGGSVSWKNTPITTLTVFGGGSFDARNGTSQTAVTNINLYQGFSYSDPEDWVVPSNGIDFLGTSPTGGTFNVNKDRTWTSSAL